MTNPTLRPFALFGMGHRRKLLYRDGQLLDALTGELLREWPGAAADYDLSEYRVTLRLREGTSVVLWEDEQAAWLREGDETTCLTEGPVNLPSFDRHPQAPLLRRLHHELLVNIVNGAPLPNLFVYQKPWYRDAAMVALCLQQTGNVPLLTDWIASLTEPFDRNNAGNEEPDNLGQLLYLLSLAPPYPPLRLGEGLGVRLPAVLAAAERFRHSDHLLGITDGQEHPVYQTKWLKFGLRALGLPDAWVIPKVHDTYSALFWMAYRDEHLPAAPFASGNAERYPYLAWAESHFHAWPPPAVLPSLQGGEATAGRRGRPPFPLTWESHASEADYRRMAIVGPEYEEQRTCVPHTWHAAEVFLYYLSR
ncbi:MAG: hypothetical protein WCP21_02595 [Armatimonadota bacterium]